MHKKVIVSIAFQITRGILYMAAASGLYGSSTATNLPRVIIAELIGTFFLVLAGTAAVVSASLNLPIAGLPADSLTVALSFGLALITLVFALGHISGAHFNPAVTLGLAFVRKFPWKYVPFYIISQLVGSLLAAETVLFMFGSRAKSVAALGATVPAKGVNGWRTLFIEAIVTFFLMLVIMAIATDTRSPKAAAGTAIGFTLAVGIIIAGPITGGALNPARALGPMIVSGVHTDYWAYIAGPILGAVIAAILYATLLIGAEEPSEAEQDS
jgi:MIP family channel proteins